MSAPVIWKEKRPIESFDVDFKGRLRAPVLFGLLTNAADGFELCGMTREADQKELCRARITGAPSETLSG